MPTIGWLSRMLPVDPKKPALPKAKTPPSAAVSQYPVPGPVVPVPGGTAAMPTIGWLRAMAPVEPA
jgi:hypothetical protein